MTERQQTQQERVESKGATVEEAVSEALLMLGARRDEVEIEVLEEPKAGVLGLFGKRAAKVAVTRRRKRTRGRRGGRRRRGRGGSGGEGRAPEARTDDRREPRGDRRPKRSDEARAESRDRGRGRGDARPAARRDDRPKRDDQPGRDDRPRREDRPRRDDQSRREPDPRRTRPERTRPDRSRSEPAHAEREPAPRRTEAGGDPESSRERSRRPRRRPERRRPGSRDEAAPVRETETPVETRPAPEREAERPPRDEPRSEPRSEPRETAPTAPAGDTVVAAELVPPTRGLSVDDAPEVQRGLAEELMRRAGFAARVTVGEGDGEYNQVKIVADADSAAVLIGRRGSTIDAVEHLVDRMALQAVGEHRRMNLDINNYRMRRHGTLEENALAAVRQLQETGKDVHTPPLVARERRIVHLTIQEIEGVTTYTAGAGQDRHVVVTFEKDEDAADPADVETTTDEAETVDDEIEVEIVETPADEAPADESHEDESLEAGDPKPDADQAP